MRTSVWANIVPKSGLCYSRAMRGLGFRFSPFRHPARIIQARNSRKKTAFDSVLVQSPLMKECTLNDEGSPHMILTPIPKFLESLGTI